MSLSRLTTAKQILHNAWNTTRTAGRDSYRLGQAWIQQPKNTKEILLQQAQHHQNTVAARILLVEKEIGLVQYHGIQRYLQQTNWWRHLQQRLPFRSSISHKSTETLGSSNTDSKISNATSNDSNLNSNNNATVARVAFMVTARMKTELADNLGYTAEQIRSMTPVQASLALEHAVLPDEYQTKIPILLQEQAQREQERAQAQQQAEQERQRLQMEQETKERSVAAAASLGATETTGVDEKQPLEPTSSISGPPETDASSKDSVLLTNSTAVSGGATGSDNTSTSSTDGVVWYELADHSAPPPDQVVALYRTEKEAQEGLQIRKDLAEGRGQECHLQIRESVR